MITLRNGNIIDPKIIVGIRVLKRIRKGSAQSYGGTSCPPRVAVDFNKGYCTVINFKTAGAAKEYQLKLHEEIKEALKS